MRSPLVVLVCCCCMFVLGEDWSTLPLEASLNAFRKHVKRNVNEEAFRRNYEYVKQRNAMGLSYSLELNEMADWDDEMLLSARRNGGHRVSLSPLESTMTERRPIDPPVFDWRDKNVVGPVKNQGQCDVCYAFASVAALESAWAVETGQLYSLSEMQIVDCGMSFGNGDCKGKNATGGDAISAFKYVVSVGGIASEDEYPYHTYDHKKCSYNSSLAVASFKGYSKVEPSGSESALRKALLNRPIAINFDATHKDFNFYKTGVYNNSHCKHIGSELDHMMLLVGYNATSNPPYYIVKNSWGVEWGYKGFMHVLMDAPNMCGIATEPAYPCAKETTC